ncbi:MULTISPECIES: ChuX/HutX family heme-like substrate-binding protein [Pseudomonas]|uniref:Hemin transport protein HemS n=2 Tax=Pseudomonas TaxID=286 RepID=A0A5E6V735_PSEFL|nr:MULTISPECIES: ChuX/HutX family heme-like substrate-binding protein [Pseudomonas]VVN13480.1 Hemin transport protein HemS [Pseudomonas fluorescens]
MTQLTAVELNERFGSDCLCLDLPAVDVAAQLHALGPVRTVTPASHAWIEQVGYYPQSDDISEAGLVIGEDGLDLRLNLRAWFRVCLQHDVMRNAYSLNVLDRHAQTLLRLTSLPQSSSAGWAALYSQCVARPSQFIPREAFAKRVVQVPGLVDEWAAMANVHEHFALLKRHGLTRYEGNALVAPKFARQLAQSSPVEVFRRLAASALELMLFVYSAGSVQIFTGRLTGMSEAGAELLFDMPASEQAAPTCFSIADAPDAQIWRVYKPNQVGGVTSLEFFDAEQRLIVQVFARRPAGQPEQLAWREWLDALEAVR